MSQRLWRSSSEILKDKGSSELSEISAKLKSSEDSARVFIGRLIRSGKVRITSVKVA